MEREEFIKHALREFISKRPLSDQEADAEIARHEEIHRLWNEEAPHAQDVAFKAERELFGKHYDKLKAAGRSPDVHDAKLFAGHVRFKQVTEVSVPSSMAETVAKGAEKAALLKGSLVAGTALAGVGLLGYLIYRASRQEQPKEQRWAERIHAQHALADAAALGR